MTRVSQHSTIAILMAVLAFGSWALASGAIDFAPDKATLPKQTSTHFFEVYHCGKLAGVVWVTPDEAALYRVQNLQSPRLRRVAVEFRTQAHEEGTAFAVHGRKGGCTDA